MSNAGASNGGGKTSAAGFQTTHWSVVLTAAQGDSPQAAQALAALCQTYWYPVYAFIRRWGHSPDDAKDLTQELFARLIAKDYLRVVDREKGRFRTFLLACTQHLLCNEWKREQAVKRGGGQVLVPLDDVTAENRYGAEPADLATAEKLFERRWALLVLDQAMEQLRQEQARAGKAEHFAALESFLSGAKDANASYAEVAAQLGMTEAAARQAAVRLRRRFGEVLRAEVAKTVANPAEVQQELGHMLVILSG